MKTILFPWTQGVIIYLKRRNTANASNSSPRGATSSTYVHSFRSSNRTLTTRPVATRRNGSHTINCIKTNTNKHALKPAIINKNTEIKALCDPCSDITVIQQSCVPADSVIQPSTDGELHVVNHKIKPVGCISLSSNVGKISIFMPKVGICTQLPYLLILGFDWQQQVQCIYEPNGLLCISTPSAFHLYECTQASGPSISCINSNELSLPPLEDAILPVAAPSLFHTDTLFIPKPSRRLSDDIIRFRKY
ncbi:hypothetical protein AVEN_7163-1 [Araneus ventricosus]|uniref:Uncharacterized protein n=1 Tax=Araneus ventricosus TaxID=182803 RepID=A0A4Y2ILV1_ARAVE|nr:hypothetical protein AVEN_7163-1 [Araneus ventricosus]